MSFKRTASGWLPEALKGFRKAEAILDATVPEVIQPSGGVVTHSDGEGGVTTTNYFVASLGKVVLAMDHPWVLQALGRGKVRGTCEFITESGSVHVVDKPKLEVHGGAGWLDAPWAIGPAVTFANAEPGDHLTLLPYRRAGSKLERVYSPGRYLGQQNIDMGVPGGQISFDGGLYLANSAEGDCGAPVMSAHGIVGIHAAGGERDNAFLPADVGEWGKGKYVAQGSVSFAPERGRGRGRRGSVASRGSRGSKRSRGSRASRGSRKKKAARGKPGKPFGKMKSEGVTYRSELVGIGGVAPGSDSLAPSANYAKNGNTLVSDYVDMVVNPWCGKTIRLPDCAIVPTATFSFRANRTYKLANTEPPVDNGSNFLFGMHSRMCSYKKQPAASITQYQGIVAAPVATYDYTPGCIMTPVQYGSGANFVTFDGSAPAGVWGDDFGTEQSVMQTYVAEYRVLAMAMRVRIVGLPASQFMAPGKIYFAQPRWNSEDVPITEQDFVNMERVGRASHVSLDAVRQSDSKSIFVSADGPTKFEMTSSFLPSPGYVVIPAGGGGSRLQFPGLDLTGATYPLSSQIAPYYASPDVYDGPEMANADQTYMLVVAVFGTQSGIVIEVDYATSGEMVPTKGAPSGVETVVQVPNSVAMDNIYASSAVLSSLKPVLIQAPGDQTIIAAPPAGFGTPASAMAAESASSRRRIHRAVELSKGGLVRPAEGLLDGVLNGISGAASGFLTGGFGGALSGGLGGLARGLTGGKPRRRKPAYDDDDEYD